MKIITFKLKEYAIKEIDEKFGKEKRLQAAFFLKSGKYIQNTGEMTCPEKPNTACCLMVVAHEIDGMPWENAINDYGSFAVPSECGLNINESLSAFMDDLGLCVSSIHKKQSIEDTHGFVGLNDKYLTHPQIGELLEGKTVELKIL